MINRNVKIAFSLLVLFGIVAVGGLLFFSKDIAVLGPAGLIGEKQARLLTISMVLMLLVVIPTFFLTFAIAWKYRSDNTKAKYSPDWDYSFAAEVVWWTIPLIISLVIAFITWRGCHELDPFKPLDVAGKPLRIQVVALQWKWLFIYPDQKIATVSYVQFPEKTPLNFEITSDAPMNSFWIPRLGGQVYAMPGMRSKLHLLANGIGSYRGSSANLSGLGFSGMTFTAESSSQEDFDRWVSSVRQSGGALDYTQLVEPSKYQPAAFYVLQDAGLFDQIIMKYMTGKS